VSWSPTANHEPRRGAELFGVAIRRKARTNWLALMPNAHEGYVSWERAEAIRKIVSSNIPTGRYHGAPKHGDALLAGLIRCRRCGRKLMLKYTGAKHGIPRYSCSRAWMDNGTPHCIAFGGLQGCSTLFTESSLKGGT
jgi:Recombinase zinc beta ribbon domain